MFHVFCPRLNRLIPQHAENALQQLCLYQYYEQTEKARFSQLERTTTLWSGSEFLRMQSVTRRTSSYDCSQLSLMLPISLAPNIKLPALFFV